MKNLNYLLIGLMLITFSIASFGQEGTYTLVIHGGAGNIARENISEEREKEYHDKLNEALAAGEAILAEGGNSLDAVEAAVRILEDSPLFNAGKGAVFNYEGKNELDASIMCGNTMDAGAVAGVTTIRNPISGARKVMENSPHVMLTGKGAEQFCYDQGMDIVDPSYFFDQRRWEQYRNFLRRRQERGALEDNPSLGTVGAVALDMQGNLAAATSTGGMTGKRFGRIGDSPVIGAGTYARNGAGAVSATGHGEFFIKHVVAYDIIAQMLYLDRSIDEAAMLLIHEVLGEMEVNVGVIAVDKDGNISMPFNTTGMFRGYVKSTGETGVMIFE